MRKRRSLDDNTCCNCGYFKGMIFIKRDMNAHHLYDKSSYPRIKYKLSMMRTLCYKCHMRFHTKWMGGYRESCTQYDYFKWRAYEEVVNLAWLKKIIYKMFKIFLTK